MTTPDPDATARVDSDAIRALRVRSSSEAQFAPGTIVAGRYRISSILGSGGMGEVYRADDVKLGQTVALKFLPARLARDPVLLARLHDEVRLGRQITHPNVCRIYDIVESEGAHFVAMEYVDGEDLSRLLKRIGRIAHDKAVDIARGIAAGLLAAHTKGILHRDLKPANVMIDSRGDSRIMDFGLALAAGETDGTISGTPAYMAPEQLEGEPATIQSDLYALGLVMYELFTGKRVHDARTLPDRVRAISSEITTPSSVIKDIDPAVERIILRCLSHDPAQRPRSARDVVLALPGGDPLAAAIAAGETPSPRIVAAAGSEGNLSRRVAWSLLAAIAALFAVLLFARGERSLGRYAPLMPSPEILHDRATNILRTFGVPATGEPITQFIELREYEAWLSKGRRWNSFRRGPAPVVYRLEYGVGTKESEVISRMTAAPGRTFIEIDAQGRLALLLAAPRAELPVRPFDFSALVKTAGLDPRSLRPVPPRFAPPAPFDTLRAWSGTYPGDSTPIRVEAAAWRGTPTFFRITGPWDEVADPFAGVEFTSRAAGPFVIFVLAIIIAAGVLLAWRNLRLRRGDRLGAFRIAAVIFICELAALLLSRISFGKASEVVDLVADSAGKALFIAAMTYLFYIALEPFIRRRWPSLLIGWARLMAGQVRDPMVGRDVLIGVLGGVMHCLLAAGTDVLTKRWLGLDDGPLFGDVRALLGARTALASLVEAVSSGTTQAIVVIVLLVVLMMVLRKRALAAGALFLVILTAFTFAIAGQWQNLPFVALLSLLVTFIAVRYGLLALAVLQTTFLTLFIAPHISAPWATPIVVLFYAATAILALWAFRTSLGGQTLLGEGVLDA